MPSLPQMALDGNAVHICVGCSFTDSLEAHVVVSGIRNKLLLLPCSDPWHCVIPRVFKTFDNLFRPSSPRSATNHMPYLVDDFDVGILYVNTGFQVSQRLLVPQRAVVNQRCFLGAEWAAGCNTTTISRVWHCFNSTRGH